MNFLDPHTTEDGRPYGVVRFKEIVRECYIISRSINTSYNEVLNITPLERRYILEFLVDDAKQKQEEYEKAKRKIENNQ